MKPLDEHDGLVAVAGMTPDQFASQTAALRGFEVPDEEDAPGAIVMRADYDNVRNALAREAADLVALTDQCRGVADAMQYLVAGGRVFARARGIDSKDIVYREAAATDATLIFRVERA